MTTSDTTGVAENHMQTSRTVPTHTGCKERCIRGLVEGMNNALRPKPLAGHVEGREMLQAQGFSLESEGFEPHIKPLSTGVQYQNVSTFTWLEDQ